MAAENGGRSAATQMGPETRDEIASLWSTDPLIAANLEAAYGRYMLGAAAAPAAAAKGDATHESCGSEAGDFRRDEERDRGGKRCGGRHKEALRAGRKCLRRSIPRSAIFVVHSDLDLTTSDGDECALTPGDVIYRTGDKPDDDHMVDATVKSSKKDECAVGVTVGVAVGDLQEMHNQLRIQMDAGLKELAGQAGKERIAGRSRYQDDSRRSSSSCAGYERGQRSASSRSRKRTRRKPKPSSRTTEVTVNGSRHRAGVRAS